MAYILFLLVNAALFLRPGEIIPALETTPGVYEVFIVLCLAVSLPRVLRQLTPRSLAARPISACVVGLLVVVVISGVYNYETGGEFQSCLEFGKLLLYYLLLVGVVDTPAKLRWFVYYLGGLILVLTALALLQYHGVINIPALASYAERQWEFVDEETGETGQVLLRLCAAGIYNNPNDLSRILMVGMLISLYGAGERRWGVLRLAWLLPLGVFGYALALTHSRGGFLGLLTALLVLLWGRFGSKKTLALALVVLPLLFVVFAGRQTSIDMSEGTGHQRLEIWSDGFAELRHSPLLGIGMDRYGEVLGIEAHNSFVHAYTELGFLGGTCFLGAFYLGLLLPYRVCQPGTKLREGELRRFAPYLLGIIAGYMMGMLSSSRNYIPPTYLLVGLAAIHVRFAAPSLPPAATRLNGRLLLHVALVSVLSLAGLYLFVWISLAHR